MTPAQLRLLNVIADAGSHGVPPGEAAFRAGYKGKGRSGAGRAPQWTGRVVANMTPEIRPKWSHGRLYITSRGLKVLADNGRQGT